MSKSEKNTSWTGYFWSGAVGQAKSGLHPSTGPSDPGPSNTVERDANLVDWYLLVLESMRDKLHRASRYVVADAYFAKNNFVTGLQEIKFDLVSRFRNDATLYYPTL